MVSRFFTLNPLHFPADFTHLSNLLDSLFKAAKLMIKITLQTGHIKSWGECEILQERKCYFICIREKIAAEIPWRNDVYKDTILNGYPPGALPPLRSKTYPQIAMGSWCCKTVSLSCSLSLVIYR